MIRILIADDERVERMILYQVLERNLRDRCTIFQAENGREALKIYRQEKIQIAILDIEMPGIDGIEAARQIREQDKDCSILFLTAFDEFSYARKAITVRALDYLLKPCDEKELMLVLEEAIRLAEEHERQAGPEERKGVRQEEVQGTGGAGTPRERMEGDRVQREEEQRPGGQNEGEESTDGRDGVPSGREGKAPLPGEDGPEEPGNALMGKVAELAYRYIRKNYKRDISMQDLAWEMNYSEAYFCKLFKQCFDKNFTAYLTEFRVKEAKKLLEQPTINVKEVGKAVGYMDPNYFARVFKRVTGQTPTEYRLELFSR